MTSNHSVGNFRNKHEPKYYFFLTEKATCCLNRLQDWAWSEYLAISQLSEVGSTKYINQNAFPSCFLILFLVVTEGSEGAHVWSGSSSTYYPGICDLISICGTCNLIVHSLTEATPKYSLSVLDATCVKGMENHSSTTPDLCVGT